MQTVEEVTGLHIDHYAEIGFGGFATMVDAVGGVRICVDQAINDGNAGLNIQAGCQKLNGAEALGYVRSRKFANGDLVRVQHQRQFLSALLSKVASPGTLINPFKSIPLGYDAVDALTVDKGTHIWDLLTLGTALRDAGGSKGYTLTVPISGFANEGAVRQRRAVEPRRGAAAVRRAEERPAAPRRASSPSPEAQRAMPANCLRTARAMTSCWIWLVPS